jgi:glutathione synthase/RimK-type ligase-like ATP-grasp enzyme
MTQRIGLLVGREWSFPPAFIDEVNRRNAGVVAELVSVGAAAMDDPCPWDVIVDRISHEVPFYRSYLKQCVLEGAAVVNNPFMWTADDKFFGAALITKLGVASPKTVALPNKDYVPGIVREESLKNLRLVDWDALAREVGLPIVLKDAHGGGWRDVYVCHTVEDLLRHYDESGLLTMVAQEFIKFEQFVRCMCLGQDEILVMPYDPKTRSYGQEDGYLRPELHERVVRDARTIVRALGYDMNSIEFAIRDGVPYAIDFMNPAPDMDIYSLGPRYFEWVVTHMADLCIRLAREGRGRQAEQVGWARLFAANRRA